MNDPNQPDIKLTTQADQYSVTPGGKLEIPLGLAKAGSTPDQFRIGVEGIPLVWVFAAQPVVLVRPGEQVQVILTIQPPAPPNAQIGRYNLIIKATSTIDPARTAQTQIALTVAGFEVKGRVGVLLESVQFPAIPGEQLVIQPVLINQGLGEDTFRLACVDLPNGWTTIPEPVLQFQPGEVRAAQLIVNPPRDSSTRASRYRFRIVVASLEAPDQSVSIDCTLTVAAFIEFNSALEAARPDQDQPERVVVQNLSNIPLSFNVSWSSPEEALTFEPDEPQQINLPAGETGKLDYTVQPARRLLVGGEKSYPYTVKVQASNRQTQTLEGASAGSGLVPPWAAAVGGIILVLLCLCMVSSLGLSGILRTRRGQATPTVNTTATVPTPTASQSPVDQRPLLVARNWYLMAYNSTVSQPGARPAFNLFNPDGTLVGYTGCKDLSATYQTNLNQITITNLNLGAGACPDAALRQQEDSMIAILRSARSYTIADTVLQVIGDAGFLNYSLTPLERPEMVQPPQAVIRVVPQAQVGQVVVFDGAASTGQAPIVSWRWDFGDGMSGASGAIVQHMYMMAGTYTVRLTVTDQRGQTGASSAQIHILAMPTPTATATLPPPTPKPPKPTATLPPPTLAPQQPTYTPVPTAIPTAEPPTATPQPVPPQASIAAPNRGYVGEPVRLDASASQPGSSPITSYSWSLGNGVDLPASPQSSVSTIYNRAGEYEVTVFVTDANGQSSHATTRITISARLNTSVWSLSRLNSAPLLPGSAITLQFQQGELTGFAGCNTYNGTYTATPNDDGTYTIAIGQIRTGQMACPQDIMGQEQSYLAILQQVTSAAIQGNMVTLNSPGGSLVYYLIEGR